MIKKIVLFLAMCISNYGAIAQTDLLSVRSLSDITNVDLQGKASVVFRSSIDDLVINTELGTDGTSTESVRNTSGIYEYEMLIDLSSKRERNFHVAIKGTTIKSSGDKRVLSPNRRYYFEVTKVENPIREDHTYSPKGNFDEGKALYIFTTAINNLNIERSDALKKISSLDRFSPEGRSVNEYRLTIDVKAFNTIKDDIEKAQKAYKAYYDSLYVDKVIAFSDETDKREAFLKEKADNLQEAFDAMTYMTVSTVGSNIISIDLSSLQNKDKYEYNINYLTETETVYANEYSEFMSQGRQMYEARKYSEAAALFQKASEVEGISDNDKSAALGQKDLMDDYSKYKVEANDRVRKINALKKIDDTMEKRTAAKYNELEEDYNKALEYFSYLKDKTKDEYYSKIIDQLQTAKDKMGIVVIGVVKGSHFKSGVLQEEAVTGVMIYGLTTPYNQKTMEKGSHGTLLGHVNTAGEFQLQIEKNKYVGLLFVPIDESKYKKNTWQKLDGNKHMWADVRLYD